MLPLLPLCMGGDFRIPAVFALFSYSAPGSACRFPAIPPGPGRRSAAFRRHISHPPHLYSFFVWIFKNSFYLCTRNGGLAQLARALAWHARGHEFESRILHISKIATAEHTFCRFCRPFSGKIALPSLCRPKHRCAHRNLFHLTNAILTKTRVAGRETFDFIGRPASASHFESRILHKSEIRQTADKCLQSFFVFCAKATNPPNRTGLKRGPATHGTAGVSGHRMR